MVFLPDGNLSPQRTPRAQRNTEVLVFLPLKVIFLVFHFVPFVIFVVRVLSKVVINAHPET